MGSGYSIDRVKDRNALKYVIRRPGGGIVNGHFYETREAAERHLELIELFFFKNSEKVTVEG